MKAYKIKKHTLSVFISLLIFFSLLLTSGFRIGGYDYTNYVDMITFTQSVDTIFSKIFIAKDPMFGLIVGFTNPRHRDEYWMVFLSIASLAYLGKLFFINDIRRCTFFSIIYVILLAPGLDFAAIRALLGMVFLLSALSYLSSGRDNLYYVFSFLAVISHISMLLPILLSSKIINDFFYKNKALVFLIVLCISIFTKPILSLFSNAAGYIDVSGSFFAFFPPILMLLASFILGYLISLQVQTEFCVRAYNLSILIAVMSFGFTFQVVVASSRFLQVSQFLFLVVLCCVCFKKNVFNIMLFSVAFLLFSIPLLYQNYDFDLWRSAWENINL
ncbi:EpsG family protein [Aeromonas salmonicida]|uniref:EpsG family protein n=1 Tax=Aeromonas salmonicida TaxID=645 RepID=UPI000B05ED82|nr:EpsG family protein [Aeromonas salmonicida]